LKRRPIAGIALLKNYVRDAEKDKSPELVKHLKMLREELVKAVKEN
jgi:translation initiation factor 2B subunit (eIF-2B alpha/beta/delta family)